MAYLDVSNLSKSYDTPEGPLQVLDSVDFSLEKGDIAGLIGQSGIGKTTFLNMITAIDTPNEGSVTIDGFKITEEKDKEVNRWRARNIGIVFQFFQLIPTVSVLQNIIAPMDLTDTFKASDRADRAMVLLDRLGIKDQAEKRPTMLSGGQQQRVAIARALANDPALIIGDELTANLDRENALNVFNILREFAKEQGSTVLVVSYDRELLDVMPKLFELNEDQKIERVAEGKQKEVAEEVAV